MSTRTLRSGLGTQRGQTEFVAEVKGAKEINTALRNIGGDPELLRALKDANQKAGDIIVQAAKKLIPVGDRPKRGKRLVDTARSAKSRTSVKVLVGSKRHFYAWMRHEGYHPRGGPTKVEGVPYLRDAISENWDKLWPAYDDAINALAEKFNRKHGLPPRELNALARRSRGR